MGKEKKLELLENLQTVLIQELLGKIKCGEAKPGDLNVARQLLKDNGIECIPNREESYGRSYVKPARPRCCTFSGVVIMSESRKALRIDNKNVIYERKL